MSRQSIFMSQKIFLCCDRVGQGEENLCRNKVFLCRDRVWPWMGFFVAMEFGLDRGF